MPPSIVALNPADTGDLDSLQPITFSVIDTDVPNMSSILAWFKYVGVPDKVLIYDSVEFSPPFADNSVLTLPEGTDRTQSFSVIPEGSWLADLEELRIEFTDEGAAGGAAPTASNLSPARATILSDLFDPTVPITFDLGASVDIAQVAVWVRFANRRDRIMVYETDGFVPSFADSSTISGMTSGSCIAASSPNRSAL